MLMDDDEVMCPTYNYIHPDSGESLANVTILAHPREEAGWRCYLRNGPDSSSCSDLTNPCSVQPVCIRVRDIWAALWS